MISTMRVSVELPDTLIEVDPRYLKEALVATLYHLGKLSGRQAREALGMTRRAFEEMLPRFGFSILVDSRENLDAELSA
jgi:hypothetical protein